MNFIKRNWGLLALLITVFIYISIGIFQHLRFKSYYETPKAGDIYIFEFEKDRFSPYFLDQVGIDSLYFFSHKYEYTGAIPPQEDILKDSFNDGFHFIYDAPAIEGFYQDDKLIKIYRTCQ